MFVNAPLNQRQPQRRPLNPCSKIPAAHRKLTHPAQRLRAVPRVQAQVVAVYRQPLRRHPRSCYTRQHFRRQVLRELLPIYPRRVLPRRFDDEPAITRHFLPLKLIF